MEVLTLYEICRLYMDENYNSGPVSRWFHGRIDQTYIIP